MKRIFLGWHKPVSVLSAEKLLGYQNENSFSAIDLSRLLVVVPTRQSGRLLENELLKIAESDNKALFPPLFKTPLNLLELSENSADAINEQTAMMEAISSFDELQSLFPKGTPKKDAGRFEAAKTICSLRSTLAEQGLYIKDAAENSFIKENEPQRWADLLKLETCYQNILKDRGLIDRTEALISGAEESVISEFEKVIVVSVPDPLPLTLKVLQKAKEIIPVEIWINAPLEKKDLFDSFGIPKEGAFTVLPDIKDDNISIVRKPADASEKSIQIFSEKEGLTVDNIALALFTDELFSPFKDSFEERGYSTYDPAGESCGEGVLYNLIKDFSQFLIEKDYETFSSLLKNPHFTEYLFTNGKDRNLFLMLLDKFHDEILPVDAIRIYNEILRITDDSQYAYLKDIVQIFPSSVKIILNEEDENPQIELLLSFLTEIYSKPKKFIDDKQKEIFSLKIKQISSLIYEFKSIVDSLKITDSEASRLLHSNIEKSSVYPSHSADSIPLQGWLEMNWSPAKHIVLAGFNEGFIPESITSDLMLPESARKALNLKNNAQRMTRDLFLMQTLIESRKDNLHIIVLKTNAQGDPLKPSRILFSCSKDKVIKRAIYLFGEDSPQSAKVKSLSDRSEQPLLIPQMIKKNPEKISVTAFKNYLECPFRYYLGRLLGMEHLFGEENQMSNLVFGTLCHWTLEQYGKDYTGELSNVEDTRAFLLDTLQQKTHEKYGFKQTLAIQLQIENAKRRLEKAAAIEVESRISGWEIVACEYKVESVIEDVLVSGKIDRIEYNSNLNKWRIIDFKTSATSEKPENTHLGKDAGFEDPEMFSVKIKEGKPAKLWKNLQLPLYIKLLENSNDLVASNGTKFDASLMNFEVGYFNLPDAITETGLYFWKGYSNAFTDAAFECASEVIKRIKNKVFWPPKTRVEFDNFEELYTEDIINNFRLSEGLVGGNE